VNTEYRLVDVAPIVEDFEYPQNQERSDRKPLSAHPVLSAGIGAGGAAPI